MVEVIYYVSILLELRIVLVILEDGALIDHDQEILQEKLYHVMCYKLSL